MSAQVDRRGGIVGAATGLLLTLGLLSAPGAAAAGPLGLDNCGPIEGVHQCSGLVETWDGVPLDTTLTMPDQNPSRLPLIVEIHGFGNSKWEYLNPEETAYTDNAFSWAREGYAVLTYTARGFWGSCGTTESRAANPAGCAGGYIRLGDARYEVRDTQEMIGRLVDEGSVHPRRIGLTGDSYGGGQSLVLAALRDRVMKPDGSTTPWRSPAGTPLRVSAAAPVIPWADLISAVAPNGRGMTTAITPAEIATTPVGVEKASVVNGLYAASQFATGPGQPLGEPFVPGRPMGYLAPTGTDPEADVTAWVARTGQGEPYTDPEAREIVRQLTTYHSGLYIDNSSKPPPLLLASGFSDDIFPADEVVRYANSALDRYPRLDLRLLLGDFGHQRASNEPRERRRLLRELHAFFGHHLKGEGRPLRRGAAAFVQRCPRELRSGGPFHARYFQRLARGEARLRSTAAQVVTSAGGDPEVAAAIDPISAGDGCVEVEAGAAPNTATYDLDPVKRRYTLIGAATAIARMKVDDGEPGNSQIAARLWDVAPDGRTQRLVARGLWRPVGGRNVFQLHPGAWTFKQGHTPRLELAGTDAPYARPSNEAFTIEVERLQMRLPIRRRPDCDEVQVGKRPPLIAGAKRAPGLRSGKQRRRLERC